MENGLGLPAALAAMGICGVALTTGVVPDAVSAPVGVAATLGAPGYCLTRALYPRTGSLAPVERLLLALGLSLAILVLNGVLLNATEPGITATTMYLLLLGEVVAFALTAWGRGAALPQVAQIRRVGGGHLATTLAGGNRTPALLAASALLALTATAWRLAAAPVTEPYVEFYLLGQDGQLTGYPTEAVLGQPFTLRVGVGNHQPQAGLYRAVVRQGDSEVGGGEPTGLGGNQVWEGQLSVIPTNAGPRERFEVLLMAQGETAPVRRLSLTLAVRDLAPPAPLPASTSDAGEPQQPPSEQADQE